MIGIKSGVSIGICIIAIAMTLIQIAPIKLNPWDRILTWLAIAQAILESGWGSSRLSQECFNYFGMKWREGCGCDYKEYLTKEQRKDGSYYSVMAKFRKYRDAADGIEGYYKFLSGYKRYHNLIGVTDAGTACDLIRQDGWATSLKYSQNLKLIVVKYRLTDWDNKVLGKKDLEAVARDVIAGKYGNGEDRKMRLREAGYDPIEVQRIVNRMV